MRVRNFREDDIPSVIALERAAHEYDQRGPFAGAALVDWLIDPQQNAPENAFVITDDDDELNTWGQAGTLEGIEGETVGYTLVLMRHDAEGYHLCCHGTVHPAQRRRNAGRALLICALNRARFLAEDFEFEAEATHTSIYFEVLFPAHDKAVPHLAEKCELVRVDRREGDYRDDRSDVESTESTNSTGCTKCVDLNSLQLYRRKL